MNINCNINAKYGTCNEVTMLRPIRIIFTSVIMSLLLVTSSIAGTILYGNVRTNPHKLSNAMTRESDQFPAKSYLFSPEAYDLQYNNNVLLEDRVKEIDQFSLSLSAYLNLISFDKTTGIIKFKLTLKTFNVLSYFGKTNEVLRFTGGTNLKKYGSLKLADGSLPEFIIEGKLGAINGKPTWISFNRNKYFDIDVSYFDNYVIKQKYYIVDLKLLHDFPVIVTSEN